MRRLIRIPIIHTSSDLGSLSGSVRRRHVEKSGPMSWHERERAVDQLWEEIREGINTLAFDYAKVRIYQDGLPVCGFEAKIVEELAGAGSLNHQLVLELVGRGATLTGTEDPQLLIQEYEMAKSQLPEELGQEEAIAERLERAKHLLDARDCFITRRIDQTLLAGETGLLFLGAAHPMDELKSTDIQVQNLGDGGACGGSHDDQTRDERS